jgi:Fe-S cluster assembly ATPase SufC
MKAETVKLTDGGSVRNLIFSTNTYTNISLTKGKIYQLTGKSGEGKSTLFRVVAGLEDFESIGDFKCVLLDSTNLRMLRDEFDEFNVMEWVISQVESDNLILIDEVDSEIDLEVLEEIVHRCMGNVIVVDHTIKLPNSFGIVSVKCS